MTKMFCFWCETGRIPRNLEEKGFVWMHLECFMNITNLHHDIKSIKERLEGRNSEPVERFIKRMEEFDKRVKNTLHYFKLLKGEKCESRE